MLATPLFFFNRRLVGVPDQWAVMVADRPLKIQRKNSGYPGAELVFLRI